MYSYLSSPAVSFVFVAENGTKLAEITGANAPALESVISEHIYPLI
jgi:hypothetical protein